MLLSMGFSCCPKTPRHRFFSSKPTLPPSARPPLCGLRTTALSPWTTTTLLLTVTLSRRDFIYVKQAKLLKEAKQVFKKHATRSSEDPMEILYMIDIIQRLGIQHHFAKEIQQTLSIILMTTHRLDFINTLELSEIALAFRLLRQGGHCVNADLFDNLKCNRKKFIEKYGEDVKGLIALYEASQLSFEGEDTLNKAGYLSCELLHSWLSKHHQDQNQQAIYVANALQYPLRYGLTRFMDNNNSIFLSEFKAKNEWQCLQELAEINSRIVRLMNQNETVEVSKWWKELGVANEAKFAGYQPLKWYTWPMACFTDPSFSYQRIELTKPISLIYVIDDIFDIHGTIDQLTIFTNAINRWDFVGTEQLPHFMKICLTALYDVTNDFADKVYKKHGLNPLDILKKSWIKLLNAFLKEAHWLNSGWLPRAEEYLDNGIISTGVHVVLIHGFFLFNHIQDITKKTIAILDNDDLPNIIYSVAKILRLSDDLEGAKSGDQNGLDGSYLDCYMNEYQDISGEETQRHVSQLISNQWRCLNQELVTSNPFPSLFSNFCLNAARMVPLMYHYKSNPSLSNLQDQVKSLITVNAERI